METKYPRQVIIDNPKLKTLLEKKTKLILEGREKSVEIDEVETEMSVIDKEIIAIEKGVDVKDLDDKAQLITDRMNAVMKDMEEVKKEMFERFNKVVPPDLKEKYETKKKFKELKETERNKIALKVQKVKDLIIPLTQKIAKPYLQEEFEDYNDIRLENGEIILEIFSHLEEFRKNIKNRMK